jgi:hypothetical protein
MPPLAKPIFFLAIQGQLPSQRGERGAQHQRWGNCTKFLPTQHDLPYLQGVWQPLVDHALSQMKSVLAYL